MGTAFLAQQAAAGARAARLLGRSAADADALDAVAAAAAAGLQARFFNASSGVVGVGGADETLWALWAGALPAAAAQPGSLTWRSVAAAIRANGTHISTGALATSMLFALGPDAGLNDLILEALSQVDFPSYGFMIAKNATSLWEHWDVFQNPASWNHAWYGSVSSYLRRQLGGVSLDESAAGYGRIVVRPHPPTWNSTAAQSQVPGQPIPARGGSGGGGGGGGGGSDIPWANTTVSTVRGDVTSRWFFEYDWVESKVTLRLLVTLPGNAACDVFVPRPVAGAPVLARGACAFAAAAGGDELYDAYRLDDFAGDCAFFLTVAL
jgi:hypothetical protein